MTRQLGELASIEVESGLSDKTHAAFVVVRATGVDGSVLYGQIDPTTMREIAHNYLAAAEAAESDAAVFAELTETLELDPAVAAAFIAALRNRRTP